MQTLVQVSLGRSRSEATGDRRLFWSGDVNGSRTVPSSTTSSV